MGATATVMNHIVVGGIVQVVVLVVSAGVFAVLLPRMADNASGARLRFWTPCFFVSLTLGEASEEPTSPDVVGGDRQAKT